MHVCVYDATALCLLVLCSRTARARIARYYCMHVYPVLDLATCSGSVFSYWMLHDETS